jgi:hypothetical protein
LIELFQKHMSMTVDLTLERTQNIASAASWSLWYREWPSSLSARGRPDGRIAIKSREIAS